MKLKSAIGIIVATLGLLTAINLNADVCCDGNSYPDGYNCCGGTGYATGDGVCCSGTFYSEVGYCCSPSEISGFISTYSSCTQDAATAQQTDDQTALTNYQNLVSITDANTTRLIAANCAGLTTALRIPCELGYNSAGAAVDSTAQTFYFGVEAYDELTYLGQLDVCKSDEQSHGCVNFKP